MNKVTALIIVTCLNNISGNAYAAPRPPDVMKISISREPNPTGFRGIKTFFQWLGEAPAFDSNQAVEFEVIVITDKPKCFGQPPGGKDNNTSHAQSNLPDNYTDVWNFYWPSDANEVIDDLRANCGPISGWCKFGIELNNQNMSDEHANFAVGSRRPELIKVNKTYYLRYPLELPDDPECHEYDNGLAWVQINMTVIPNTCTSVCGSKRTCPHLLGAPKCDETKIFREEVPEGEECRSIIKRLCAPVIEYTFSPYDIGFSDVTCGGGEEGGGACIDEDQDGYFALFQNSSGNWIPMFGSHTGDCEDDPGNPNASNIDNSNYNPATGICTTLVDPPLDPCGATTSGNGYYCGSNSELLDYQGNPDDLVLCEEGNTVSVQSCALECVPMPSGQNDECEQACTPVCSTGETRCSGNNVEICAPDRCSFSYDHTCGSNQTCLNGQCITQSDPPPTINSVSCTDTMRGESATCTIYGNNFDCGGDANTYIAGFFSGNVPCTSTQIVISGTWICNQQLGPKQVSHRNPDNRRDDTYNLVELLMGELQITSVWQQTVHQGDTGVDMGANGCNFGQEVVFYTGGIDPGNTVHLQSEDQVLATGNVVGTVNDSPTDVCIAKFPNATDTFDKKCWYGYIDILP